MTVRHLIAVAALCSSTWTGAAFGVAMPDKRVNTVKVGIEAVRWEGTDADREELSATFLSAHVPVAWGLRVEGKYWKSDDDRLRSGSVNVLQHRSGFLLGGEYAIPWYFRWSIGLGAESISTTAETRLDFQGERSGDSRTRREWATTTRVGIDYAFIEHVETSLHFGWRERTESSQSDYFYGLAGAVSF
jgi:hypothetical protein